MRRVYYIRYWFLHHEDVRTQASSVHDVAISVLVALMGFAVLSSSHKSSYSLAKRTNATIDRLDTCVGNKATSLRADGSKKVGGYRQKLYDEKSSMYHSVALALPVQKLGEM